MTGDPNVPADMAGLNVRTTRAAGTADRKAAAGTTVEPSRFGPVDPIALLSYLGTGFHSYLIGGSQSDKPELGEHAAEALENLKGAKAQYLLSIFTSVERIPGNNRKARVVVGRPLSGDVRSLVNVAYGANAIPDELFEAGGVSKDDLNAPVDLNTFSGIFREASDITYVNNISFELRDNLFVPVMGLTPNLRPFFAGLVYATLENDPTDSISPEAKIKSVHENGKPNSRFYKPFQLPQILAYHKGTEGKTLGNTSLADAVKAYNSLA